MKYRGHEIKKFDKRDPLVADGTYKSGYYVYRGQYGVGNFEGAYETLKEAKDSIDETPYQRWQRTYPKRNPRGGRTMARRTTRKSNARAADRWGVYVKSQLAYVSTKKLDANKAASRLRLSGRANISIKPVGPNPISGIVPKVGWRAEFKKAAYSAMKAPGVRRKRARTTSKIRRTRQRRGENPRRSNPSFTEWIVEGKTFYSLSGDKRSEAIAYAKRLADERGTNVQLTTIKGYAQRDPSGFIYDSTEDSETTITVRPKRRRNAAGPSSRAVAGRIGRAVGARIKSRNPKVPYTLHDGTGKVRLTDGNLAKVTKAAKMLSDVRKNYNDNGYTEIRDADGKVVKSFVWTLYGVKQRNPRREGIGTRSVMRGGTFRGAVGRKRNAVFYEVIVGNIGKVHEGSNAMKAYATYNRYVKMSKSGSGRAAGEDVSLWKNNEPIKEHYGTASESNPRRRRRNAPSILRRRNPTYVIWNNVKNWRVAGYTFKSRSAAEKAAERISRQSSQSTSYSVIPLMDAKRREKSKIVRRSNPRTSANPSSGYVVQVGNTVAWVGKLAADAQKAMRKLMAGGRKGVKGFAAKLPVGIKRGWRSQFKAVSRKRNSTKRPTVAYGPPGTVVKTRAEWGSVTNAKDYVRRHGGAAFVVNADGRSGVVYTLGVGGRIHERKVRANASFGKGKLGSGSRFKSCVRTMKRRGVASPSGLCASIGRRKYGAKRMARMAKRGRARRSNPQSGYAIQSEAGTYLGKAKTLAEARKKAARELRKSKYYQQLYIYWFPGGDGEWKVVEKVRLGS